MDAAKGQTEDIEVLDYYKYVLNITNMIVANELLCMA